jgi:hypothetical protein
MALMVIYGDSMMEYRRLPSALKAVLWSAVGVSLLLLCLAVLFMILD